MLEQETELIKQIVVESAIGSRDSVRLSEILTTDLPRGIKAYMTAEVMKLLEDDFRQSPRLAQVSRGLGGTEATSRSVLRTLAAGYTLQRNEFLSLAENAINFTENYVCRPQWTLQQFLFEKSDTITVEALARAFEYVVDYAYYRELVLRYLQRNGLREISADGFRALVARIDEEIVKLHSPRELALLAKPIYDFLLFGDSSMTRPIPVAALLVFYEDKKLTQVKEYLERICAVRSRSQLSMNELIEILEDLYHVEHAVQEDMEQSEQEIFDHQASKTSESTHESETGVHATAAEETEIESVVVDEAEIASAPVDADYNDVHPHVEETPRADVFRTPRSELERDIPPVDLPPPHVENADLLVEYARERIARKQAPFITFGPRGERDDAPTNPPTGDLHTLFTGDVRSRVIKKIFKGDENALYVFLAALKSAPTWRDAQPYLIDLFEMNHLNHLSPEVIEFTDVLHGYYHPEVKKVE